MNLHDFTSRLGAPAMTAIVEDWENYAGVKIDIETPFEQRWLLMTESKRPRSRMIKVTTKR